MSKRALNFIVRGLQFLAIGFGASVVGHGLTKYAVRTALDLSSSAPRFPPPVSVTSAHEHPLVGGSAGGLSCRSAPGGPCPTEHRPCRAHAGLLVQHSKPAVSATEHVC